MKAVKIYPSNPIKVANGFRKFAIWFKIDIPLKLMFAKIHITIPAGAAIATALPKTNNVLSKIERTKTFPNCGFLYGGSSNTKDDGIPLRIVLESILDITSVIIIPITTSRITARVDKIEDHIPKVVPAINIEAIVIKNGNLPVTRNKVIGKYGD